ncbi:MAG: hypothetical protein ACI9M6_001702 [Hydrogenophaga sp.]|jgi:hypothetical protein
MKHPIIAQALELLACEIRHTDTLDNMALRRRKRPLKGL